MCDVVVREREYMWMRDRLLAVRKKVGRKKERKEGRGKEAVYIGEQSSVRKLMIKCRHFETL